MPPFAFDSGRMADIASLTSRDKNGHDCLWHLALNPFLLDDELLEVMQRYTAYLDDAEMNNALDQSCDNQTGSTALMLLVGKTACDGLCN